MKLFIFEGHKLELNKDELLLVKEFADLWEVQRNKVEGDTRGYERKRAFREFTYIYLMYDWESPYKNFSEQEKHIEAVADSGLTQKQMEDERFKKACGKYQDMQETHMSKLLKSAYRAVDEVRLYYELVNLQTIGLDGKPIHDSKKVLDTLGGLAKVISSLEYLEEVVRKQKQLTTNAIRGDQEPGLLD